MPEPSVIDTQPPRPMAIRVCGRSFMALVLAPLTPIDAWLEALDAQMSRAPAFLAGKAVILDLNHVSADDVALAGLQNALSQRGIQPVSIEGGQREWPALVGWTWPSHLVGGRDHPLSEVEDDVTPTPTDIDGATTEGPLDRTLFVDEPVRSGQIVTWLQGDIVVTGGVASGAEVVASGSIHIYGPLRGRAIAGVGGNSAARILTRRMFAELLAIDGFYMTAEEIDQQSVGQPAQAMLEGEQIRMQPLT